MSARSVRCRVNGQEYEEPVEVRWTLADFLREKLGLTGTHLGCEHGMCGACTVIVNGAAVRSCLMFAVQAQGADIMTVEGLGSEGALHPIQEAFREHHALQCGFCTPGFLNTVYCFLRDNPKPSREQIRTAISGNLCRCTGYENILRAVEAAAVTLAAPAGAER
jgi:aerobic-type carbon monoxide dehydrogenase small subunit (CoxS/CutS family)